MSAVAELPVARWWRALGDGRLACELCPRGCKLRDGQDGFCFSRGNRGGVMRLLGHGRTSGFAVDPIEKKPFAQFLPGTRVLSFGTVGCNLACRFCQNWRITRARAERLEPEPVAPEQIAAAARRAGCASVAFTYNDPVIFAEYAQEVAAACRAAGLRTVAVTAGYIGPAARAEFFAGMDAANVDLKAFTEAFYRRWCGARLGAVLDTLAWLHRETRVWLEVTTLLIPGLNDSAAELDRASDWFAATLGPEVPWHFSAFHPDGAMLDRSPTPLDTLRRARRIAQAKGLRYVYTGNLRDRDGERTWCPHCGKCVIDRDGYRLLANLVRTGRCEFCGGAIAGVFRQA
ncbi:MAG TPA: AmmeMemoRadiSam system radical SAM enzyme [Opitutaceae bacterium]|nr:AmmeMemoRadiSam system radical SAM enzyme [Opitutaceae bacterium]